MSNSGQPTDCSPPGSSVHGILQARILEWVAIFFSGGLPDPGIKPVSLKTPNYFASGFFTTEPPGKPHLCLFCHLAYRVIITIFLNSIYMRSVQFSRSVVSNSLRPHESQHARPPCPSPTPGVHSDSRPSSQRRHPAISSSVVPFSSCPQSLPTSESFPMSQLFT